MNAAQAKSSHSREDFSREKGSTLILTKERTHTYILTAHGPIQYTHCTIPSLF